jgi:3-methylcrotonyl-CoA carboxylase beta subunit
LYPASELHGIVGTDVRQAFDMRDVIARIVDGSRFREFKKEYGPTIITVCSRLGKIAYVMA